MSNHRTVTVGSKRHCASSCRPRLVASLAARSKSSCLRPGWRPSQRRASCGSMARVQGSFEVGAVDVEYDAADRAPFGASTSAEVVCPASEHLRGVCGPCGGGQCLHAEQNSSDQHLCGSERLPLEYRILATRFERQAVAPVCTPLGTSGSCSVVLGKARRQQRLLPSRA